MNEELQNIEEHRVDRHIQDKKIKTEDWNTIYTDRFTKRLKDREKRIKQLELKYNPPLQEAPAVRIPKAYRSVRRTVGKIEDRISMDIE